MKSTCYLSLFFILILFSCQKENSLHHLPQVQFALQEIEKSKAEIKTLEIKAIWFELDTLNLEEQAYNIEVSKDIIVKGGDETGLMYGGLEVAEQLQLHGKVKNTSDKPYIKQRGIKFNIPLDSRTPSYDDTGDAALKNYAEMWNWDFWQEYLDDLAIHRYNVLTLWNPHPFPSMVKLPNYPDVALDDVYITTLKPTGIENEWAEPQMVSSNVVENMQMVKKMTIDEKIEFWQKVMRYAKNRGIDIYFFNWNLCANGAAKPLPPMYRTYNQPMWDEAPGKYGINNQMDNPINVNYYNESVKTFLKTYPDVKGIGVTAGEHMQDEGGNFSREQWIWESYGKAMVDVLESQPNREINFIHRVWNTDMTKIMNYWKDYPGSFEASFKYAKARLYSSPYLNFADKHIEAMKSYNLKSWWNLRNDDIFVHRWGDADYVKAFIGHFQKEHTAGYYMGSDGYVWGKEFVSKHPELSGELEIKKHWFNFMLWGRLGYNNNLDTDFFQRKLQHHFPNVDAKLLYEGWQSASKIIPLVNVFHWNDWDYQWSVEACIDARVGFHDVERFMTNRTIPNGNYLNPIDFAIAKSKNEDSKKTSPYNVSEDLEKFANASLQATKKLKSASNSAELSALLDDINSMSYLGLYYAAKIEAAAELAFFKQNGKQIHKTQAIMLLENAVEHWTNYKGVCERNYYPQMLARTKMLDWSLILEDVKKDIEIAKNFK
ncbi:MAG: hypothetical protein ACON5F_12570 [Jejuia sp.]